MDRDEVLDSVKRLSKMDEVGARRFAAALNDALSLLGRYSIRFRGEFSLLNPLLSLYEDDAELFENVLALLRKHRGDAVFEGRSRKYMADFMREKRAREKRAVDLENRTRPADKQLRGAARITFAKKVAQEWNERRLQMLEKARASSGGRIPMERVQELSDLFWKQIDQELDELDADLR